MNDSDLSNIREGNRHINIYNARFSGNRVSHEKGECYVCKRYGDYYLYIVSTGGRFAGGWYYAHFCSQECLNLMLLRYL